jgi:hypothetical protein
MCVWKSYKEIEKLYWDGSEEKNTLSGGEFPESGSCPKVMLANLLHLRTFLWNSGFRRCLNIFVSQA